MKNSSTRYDNPRWIARILVPLLLAPAYLCAQSPPRFGPVLGYEFGAPLSIDRTPGAINTMPGFDGSGVSANHTLWLGGTTEWPDMLGDKFSLSGTLSFGISRGSFTSNPYPADLATVDPTGTVFPDTSRFALDITTGTVQIDLKMLYDLQAAPVAFGFGGWLGYRALTSINYTESRVSASPIFLPDAQTSTTTTEQPASPPLSGGILGSVSTRVPIGNDVEIRPELYVRLDIPTLRDGFGKQAFATGLGISMLFESTGRESHPAPTVPIASRLTTPPEASIDLYCTTTNGGARLESATVSNRRILHSDHVALLPRIFFDHDSSRVPSKYDRRGEVERFTIDSLAGLEELEVNYRLLNIVGFRMRTIPASQITLLGSVSSEEPIGLAAARATQVRAYLHEVWGIDEGRIRIGTGGTIPGFGRSDAAQRAVNIVSRTPELLAPVEMQWIVQELAVPTIGIDPKIVAERLNKWTISIRHGDVVAARYSNLDAENSQQLDLAFLLDGERSDSTLQPLVAELTVEDSSGESTSARDTLQLQWNHSDSIPGDIAETDRQQIRHIILADPDDSAPGVADVRTIAASVRNGAAVTITAPAIPTASGRRPIFPQRTTSFAENLLGAIRLRGMEISEFHLIPTDYPEGAARSVTPEQEMLRSGMIVTVEQRLPVESASRP